MKVHIFFGQSMSTRDESTPDQHQSDAVRVVRILKTHLPPPTTRWSSSLFFSFTLVTGPRSLSLKVEFEGFVASKF